MSRENWKCFKLKDESVYYGEVAYLTSGGDLLPPGEDNEEAKAQCSVIRHGYGIQLFQTNESEVHCKFEGEWHMDKKHGSGRCEYPNGDVYEGQFQNERKHGWGKFVWKDGKTYEGEWVKDRMDGKGTFAHPTGLVHEGEFRANYFIMGEFVVNPFYSAEKLEEDLQQQRNYKKLYNRLLEAKRKEVKLHRIDQLQELESVFEALESTGRVSLVTVTQQSFLKKSDLYETLKKLNTGVVEIDLRHMNLIKKQAGREEARQTLRSLVAEATTKGLVLVLNLDDSSTKYEELYYPDITEFFHTTSFPPYLLAPKAFKEADQLWDSFAAGEDLTLDQNFRVVVWSKVKFDENLDDQDILAKFIKCFSRALSLDNIDCVVCRNHIEEEEVAPESPLPEEQP